MLRQVGAIILCIFILSIANPGYVVSEAHGLSMGFSEGAEFHYSVLSGIIDDYYIVVDEIEPLPEDLTNFSQSSVNFTGYWSNGTEFPEMYDMIVFWGWVPIGNWTYLKTLFEYEEEPNWVDTETLFGVDNSVEGFPALWTFLKADGALFEAHFVMGGPEIHYIRADSSTTTTTSGTTSTPTTTPEPTDGPTGPSLFERPEILVISIAGVGVVLILALVIMRKR